MRRNYVLSQMFHKETLCDKVFIGFLYFVLGCCGFMGILFPMYKIGSAFVHQFILN